MSTQSLLMDCHCHTGISPDGSGTVEELLVQAKKLQLPVLAVTEHVEMNRYFSKEYYQTEPRNEWEFFSHDRVLEQSLETVYQLKPKAKAMGIHLLCGVELGQANADFTLSEIVLRNKRLDFVIGSLHELLDLPDFFCLEYTEETVKSLLERYFKELLDLCNWGKFDVLGHMTYPLRYMQGEAGIAVDLLPYVEPILDCLRAIIARGKGLELNTSGLRQPYGKPFPTLAILKLYRELGGEILTLGSDAHTAADLGKGIPEGKEIAKAAGFSYVCYFQNRNPVFVPLD